MTNIYVRGTWLIEQEEFHKRLPQNTYYRKKNNKILFSVHGTRNYTLWLKCSREKVEVKSGRKHSEVWNTIVYNLTIRISSIKLGVKDKEFYG